MDAEREAAFARIRQWGDPVLRTRAAEVTAFDDLLRRQVADMVAIMEGADGAGLAAPQIGTPNRVLVYRLDRESEPQALVNPVLVSASEETEVALEGCLSLGRASVRVDVERPVRVVVRGRGVDGEEIEIDAEHDHARVLQHEMDHLDGVLMVERAAREQRREALRALREGRPWMPARPELSER